MSLKNFIMREKCGVFGIWNNEDAVHNCAFGMFALQHRGHEGCGVISIDDNGKFYHYHRDGLVSFNDIISSLRGKHALGHVRYSTSGNKLNPNVFKQPACINTSVGKIALAHNGNIINTKTLLSELIQAGHTMHSDVDTEIIINLIAASGEDDLIQKIICALQKIKGAFSLVIFASDKMIGLRDPFGIRPLVLGKLNNSFIFASESCALDTVDATLVRDVRPGEMIVIETGKAPQSLFYTSTNRSRFCIFEYVYFARSNSKLEGISVYQARKNIGARLAMEETVKLGDNTVVLPIPDSAVPIAMGYSKKAEVPMELGISKNSYTGRTFIEPFNKERQDLIYLKYAINQETVIGKDIILIDDSIVRGNTIKSIVKILRKALVKSVHMRVASPGINYPCFYGIDTPDRSQLIYHKYKGLQLAEYFGIDSIQFLSLIGLKSAIRGKNLNYCDACFSGEYPVKDHPPAT